MMEMVRKVAVIALIALIAVIAVIAVIALVALITVVTMFTIITKHKLITNWKVMRVVSSLPRADCNRYLCFRLLLSI